MSETIWARAAAKLKRKWGEYTFNRVASGVFETAPLQVQGESPVFLSQLCRRNVAASPGYQVSLSRRWAGPSRRHQ